MTRLGVAFLIAVLIAGTLGAQDQPQRPQEDPHAICRKGPDDLAHNEHGCDCQLLCSEPDEQGQSHQIENTSCQTYCHAIAKRDPDGKLIQAGGCLCHTDNPCEIPPEL